MNCTKKNLISATGNQRICYQNSTSWERTLPTRDLWGDAVFWVKHRAEQKMLFNYELKPSVGEISNKETPQCPQQTRQSGGTACGNVSCWCVNLFGMWTCFRGKLSHDALFLYTHTPVQLSVDSQVWSWQTQSGLFRIFAGLSHTRARAHTHLCAGARLQLKQLSESRSASA